LQLNFAEGFLSCLCMWEAFNSRIIVKIVHSYCCNARFWQRDTLGSFWLAGTEQKMCRKVAGQMVYSAAMGGLRFKLFYIIIVAFCC